MRKTIAMIFMLHSMFLLTGCGGSGGTESSDSSTNINISGAVQKGPFVVGSTVTVNRLSQQGENTDSTITTNTHDDLGNFNFTSNDEGLVQISSTGYYRNEITGELSYGTLTLRSIYQVTPESDQYAYVNLLTHIISSRILGLIKDSGMEFDEASSQAESEFLSTFSEVIPNSIEDDFTSLTIFGDQSSAGSSYLLAASAIFYQYAVQQSLSNSTNPDAELTLLINQLESDFRSNGVIDDSTKLAALREVIPDINPSQVQENIDNWIDNVSGYSPADINEYLDSDLDGVFNSSDQDDDNDGMDDLIDPSPYTPDFVVSDQNIVTDEDVSIVVDISSNNPMNDVTNLDVTQQPKNGSIIGSYPELIYTPNSDYYGVDDFKYVLSQSSITSEEVTIFIEIQPINDSPVISGTPSNTITANNLYSFTPSVLNIENDQLIFNIENLPDWADFSLTTGELSGTPVNSDVGNYQDILISVSDGVLSMSLDAFSIAVAQNPWSQLPSMQVSRHAPSAAAEGGKVYVSGGFNNNGGNLATLEEYDVGAGAWSTKASMQIGRRGHSSHVIDSVLYVIGGENSGEMSSVEAYDIATNLWSNKAPLTVERSFHSSCVYGGNIYVFGGFTEDGVPNVTHTQSLATVEMYDPNTNTWIAKSSMAQNNWGMSCAIVNDKIYVLGGANNEFGYDIYDPLLDSWSAGGALNTSKRYGFAVSVVDDKLYVLGGYTNSDVVEALDLYANSWTTKSSMPTARQDVGYVSIGTTVYIVGGRNGASNNLSTFEAYSPLLD